MCNNFTQALGKSSCAIAEALPMALFQVTDLLENSNLKLFHLLATFVEDPFHCTRFYGMASPSESKFKWSVLWLLCVVVCGIGKT